MISKQLSNAYNRGYKAGVRRIVIAWLGGKCQECGTTENLEIGHIKPVERQWRHYTDWLDRDNVKLVCTSCNQGEENGRRRTI
ncbi:unnamed protein product [marine sediment metagenome]|uniref:HNH domain-containing protein n=1 Tax=marine sediment metagenome TaxID=412755 RepID=X0W5G9_9ZZZZ